MDREVSEYRGSGEAIDIAAKRRRVVLFTVVGVAFSAFWVVVI